MSYLVLARKYRPKSFSDMVGQGHVVQALSNALVSRRLHHAYLFTGTRGVGKTTVSRILAKSLNCQGPDGTGEITANPCGVCPACSEIDSGRFVDYTELDAASNRGVDEIQQLLEQAVYKPVQGRFKVFMIDEVHMLTPTAFNAMLKTLEEPPDYLKFVLATTDPQKVPVTVLSRCLQFNLRPMAPETILEHLSHVLQAEQVAFDAQSLRLLARAARGSMRDALSLTDQAIAFGSGALEEATVRQMLGSADRSQVFRLIDALAAGDGRAVVQTSEALRLAGLSAASTLEEMSLVLQRMAVLQAVPPSADWADPADPEAAELLRLSQALPPDETQLLYSLCLHGRAELGLAPDEYAGLTMVLLRLLPFKRSAASGRDAGLAAADPAEKKTLKIPEALAPGREPLTTPQQAAPATASPATRSAISLPISPARADARPARADASGSAPVLHRLPVVEAPPSPLPLSAGQNEALEVKHPRAVSATEVVAIPVRPTPPVYADVTREDGRSVPLQATPEGDLWHQIVQQLVASEAVTALARELALQSQLLARDTDHWLLRVERESLNSANSRERLQAALQAAGHAVSLGVEIGRVTDSPARRNAAAAAERQLAAEKLIFEDPRVQQMMRDFGAKIVPGSIQPVEHTQG